MQTKKVFTELYTLLNANLESTVASLMPQLLELMASKNNGETSYKVDGEVVAVYCYYHKKWELVRTHAYGAKASTSTGLNTMCKLGVSEWTKQQRQAKNAKSALLAGVADGTVSHLELHSKLEEIEANKESIIYADVYPIAYDTIEELQASLAVPKKAKKTK